MDLEKAFDRVPRKVMEWALRKKGLVEVLVQGVIVYMRVQGRKSELDEIHRKNFGCGLVCIKGLCYHH